MGKVEKQQKKLEAIQKKEEQKRQKNEEKKAKKASRLDKVKENTPKINLRAERTEILDESVEFKPKNTNWKKIVAIILWLIIGFLVLQGIVAILGRESSEDLKRTMDSHYEQLSQLEASQMEAGTFVSSFLRDYYTYSTENNTWNERVSKFLASGVMIEEPSDISEETLVDSEVRKIAVEKNWIDVDVYVQVKYTSSTSDGEKTVEKEGTLKHMVRVPVMKQGDNYAVVSAPIYVADTNRSSQMEYEANSLEGDSPSPEVIDHLKTTAGNFLKAYYGTKPSELKYYVTPDFGALATVGGTMKFIKISNCQAVKSRGGYTVKVDAVINNGFTNLNETVYLEMTKGEENRTYIKELKTRQ